MRKPTWIMRHAQRLIALGILLGIAFLISISSFTIQVRHAEEKNVTVPSRFPAVAAPHDAGRHDAVKSAAISD